jgi:hypothetical protein
MMTPPETVAPVPPLLTVMPKWIDVVVGNQGGEIRVVLVMRNEIAHIPFALDVENAEALHETLTEKIAEAKALAVPLSNLVLPDG